MVQIEKEYFCIRIMIMKFFLVILTKKVKEVTTYLNGKTAMPDFALIRVFKIFINFLNVNYCFYYIVPARLDKIMVEYGEQNVIEEE